MKQHPDFESVTAVRRGAYAAPRRHSSTLLENRATIICPQTRSAYGCSLSEHSQFALHIIQAHCPINLSSESSLVSFPNFHIVAGSIIIAGFGQHDNSTRMRFVSAGDDGTIRENGSHTPRCHPKLLDPSVSVLGLLYTKQNRGWRGDCIFKQQKKVRMRSVGQQNET